MAEWEYTFCFYAWDNSPSMRASASSHGVHQSVSFRSYCMGFFYVYPVFVKFRLTLCKQTSIMVLTNVMVWEIVSLTLCVWFTKATRVCQSRYPDRTLDGFHCNGRNVIPYRAQASRVHECVTLPFCFVMSFSLRYQYLLIGWTTLGDRQKHEFMLIFHEQEHVDCIFCVSDQYGVVRRHLHYT